ncbi:hypothetical protein O4H49_02720 [Kiloniella laminariae]|uniref:Uncharacterized protein n=1 Tax=Kiloniella laminariae TaxID=454162 RepID=A0ABT4LFG6_9PROT|nr:hypothetical protein [Kiloniella laminariae]MCZ4279675.1 hypothetical protein [Kiloniella laminariae]
MQAQKKKTGLVAFLVAVIFLVANLGLVPGSSAADGLNLSGISSVPFAALSSVPGHAMDQSAGNSQHKTRTKTDAVPCPDRADQCQMHAAVGSCFHQNHCLPLFICAANNVSPRLPQALLSPTFDAPVALFTNSTPFRPPIA